MIVIKAKRVVFKLMFLGNKPNINKTICTEEASQKIYKDFENNDSLLVNLPFRCGEHIADIPVKLVEENGEIYLLGSGELPFEDPNLIIEEDHTIYDFYIEEETK